MKRLILFFTLSLIFLAPSVRADQYRATITVTNTPTVGDTININGDVRAWTNIGGGSAYIQFTNMVTWNATNLFNAYTSNSIAGPTVVTALTNGVRITGRPGQSLTGLVSSTTWGYITFTTNVTAESGILNLPLSTAESSAAVRTNRASQIVTGVNDYATNKFSASVLPGTQGLATNTAAFGATNSIPTLNQFLTNDAQRSFALATVTLAASNAASAGVEFYSVLSGTTNRGGIARFGGTIATNQIVLPMFLQPSAVYWVTNLSEANTSATLTNLLLFRQ